jgi:hypothetical protein
MKLRFIEPWSSALNIGGSLNEIINKLPDDCYIVARDGDTMFLTPKYGNQIEQIIKANPQYDVITCMTNRIGIKEHCVAGMFDIESISAHITMALAIEYQHGTECIDTHIAPGMLMIFHKSVWQKHKFEENSIFFDKIFSKKVIASGGKIGLAKGLYLLHLYRWNQDSPKTYREHLRPVPPKPPGLRENHDGLSM